MRGGPSANPGGRPAAFGLIRALARTHTATAFEQLADIAQHGKTDTVRIAACSTLLAYGWGKPTALVARRRSFVGRLLRVLPTWRAHYGIMVRSGEQDKVLAAVTATRWAVMLLCGRPRRLLGGDRGVS